MALSISSSGSIRDDMLMLGTNEVERVYCKSSPLYYERRNMDRIPERRERNHTVVPHNQEYDTVSNWMSII